MDVLLPDGVDAFREGLFGVVRAYRRYPRFCLRPW